MDAQAQVEKAIEIAWNPTVQADLKPQALTFLESFKSEPSAWQVCLAIFTREPRASDFTRHYCMEVLNYTVQLPGQSPETLNYLRGSLMDYARQTYGLGSQLVDTPHIQNKLTQTFTYLFISLYASEWPGCFDDFRALAGDGQQLGIQNPRATALYLRFLGSVHDEIADTLQPKEPQMQKKHGELKDLIRARDAQKIAASWQEILAKWQWQQMDASIVEMCLRTISRWVMWIDISLVVNETIINALFEISRQQTQAQAQAQTRDAAIDTFTEIIAKKMQAAEKVQLMRVLNIGTVVSQLSASPALADQLSSEYDTDLAETVAKLVNTVMTDIVKVVENDGVPGETRQQGDELLQVFVPYLLRFFSDEFDEICSTVIPSLTDLLTFFRKIAKAKGGLAPLYHGMLLPILEVVIRKMKIDESLPWGDESEQTEEAEFQELRKRLYVLQQTISVIDEPLYIQTVSRVVADTFTKFESNPNSMNWRDLDLALHEMYQFGELAVKNGGLYAKREPSSAAAQTLVEMMSKMVQTGVGSHAFPSIQLQFMEICVRYSQFFEQNPQYIPQVLESFVQTIHLDVLRVKTRSWYLFLRFVKPLRAQLGNVSQTVIQAIADLLKIKAELPRNEEDEDDMDSDDKGDSAEALFDSQLNLFETVGCLSSAPSVPVDQKIIFAQSITNPIFGDMEQYLGSAKSGDESSVLQLHHDIMALGTLARGFSDWMPGASSGVPPPSEVGDEFTRASEAILVALQSLKASDKIRTAARFSLSRMIGVLGSRVLGQLPRWIDGLLSDSSTNDEMSTFLRLLDQIIFGFKTEIANILDTILGTLLQRVFAGLAAQTNGTDDAREQAGLKFEFLSFILVVLNHDLASVLVSTTNQATFDTIVNVVTHYASDVSDVANARVALDVFTKMTVAWGGPDVVLPQVPNGTMPGQQQQNGVVDAPQPVFPGFDSFAVSRFSPLVWIIPSSTSFKAKDPQARTFITQIAALQETTLRKTGQLYIDELRRQLSGMGANDADIERYVAALVEQVRSGKRYGQQEDNKGVKGAMTGFRGFLVSFLDRGGGPGG
ncbi:Exportin-T [Rhizodiscina lignyota]|uniref:Exportin-T n=1 Tax=Rhizodiscina lignyota TaxID=1504668 RepID=A0A9P4M760_9PEZI|nr:Exportin-T [Rhizodiscina lignyota]